MKFRELYTATGLSTHKLSRRRLFTILGLSALCGAPIACCMGVDWTIELGRLAKKYSPYNDYRAQMRVFAYAYARYQNEMESPPLSRDDFLRFCGQKGIKCDEAFVDSLSVAWGTLLDEDTFSEKILAQGIGEDIEVHLRADGTVASSYHPQERLPIQHLARPGHRPRKV